MIAITEMAALARSRTWRSFAVGLGRAHTHICQASMGTSIAQQHGQEKARGGLHLAAVRSTMSLSLQAEMHTHGTFGQSYRREMYAGCTAALIAVDAVGPAFGCRFPCSDFHSGVDFETML